MCRIRQHVDESVPYGTYGSPPAEITLLQDGTNGSGGQSAKGLTSGISLDFQMPTLSRNRVQQAGLAPHP